MNNTCQNNFCIMLGFCQFLRVKLFFLNSIFFLIFEFYFAILRNLAHSIARALQLLTFSEFLCLNTQNGTDGNHDSGQGDQGTPKEKQREAWGENEKQRKYSTIWRKQPYYCRISHKLKNKNYPLYYQKTKTNNNINKTKTNKN